VTYCSTVPSLCALEKRVHVNDPALLPDQIMVEYEVPDDLAKREVTLDDLPADWGRRETQTQRIGDAWLDGGEDTLLVVPSVIVPIKTAPDRNILINHRRADAARITVVDAVPFALDPRLFTR
jgi:RES domain-containing protein